MEDNNNKNKIILKKDSLPGVDMSISDFTQVHTITVVWSKVTKKMYKKSGQTFIGLKDKLNAGEVIKVGCNGLFYRIIKLTEYTDREGFMHRLQRIDGNLTTSTDMDAIDVGDKVKITNRRSFEQQINYACSMREENPIPTTVDLCCTDSCDNLGIEPVDPPLELPCSIYNVEFGGGATTLTYIDCENNEVTIPAPPFSVTQICGIPGQILECPGCKGFESTETLGGCN